MTEEFLRKLLEEHFPELKEWVEEKCKSMKQEEVEEILHCDPVKKLPKKLSNKLKNKRAFRRAYKRGLISYEQGEWHNNFKNVRHFSYFCARCFSDDYLERGMLKRGGYTFPACPLQDTFKVVNVRESRNNLLKTKISDKYKYIDILFDKYCKWE